MRPVDALIVLLCSICIAPQLAAMPPRMRQPVPCRPAPPTAGRWSF